MKRKRQSELTCWEVLLSFSVCRYVHACVVMSCACKCMYACVFSHRKRQRQTKLQGREQRPNWGWSALTQTSAKILLLYLLLLGSKTLRNQFLNLPPTDVRQVIDPTSGDYFTM